MTSAAALATAAAGRLRARRLRGVGMHLVLAALSAVALLPVVWAAVSSFKPPTELYDLALVPRDPTLDNYRTALDAFPLGRLLLDSTVIAGAVAVGQVLLALLAAYGVTRYEFRGRGVLFAVMVGTILVPQQTLILPNYLLVARLGWLDSYLGLIVPQIATAAAGVFLLRQHLRGFPRSLLDAAELDGATDWQVLWRVVVPNLWPSLVALLIILFIQTWNEYLWPLLITTGVDRTTIQVGLRVFQTEEGNAWGPLMAAASMSSVPLLVAYTVAQRRIIDAFLRAGIR